MTDERRDDTEFVQGFLDRGEPIPDGDYWCPDGVTIPAGYVAKAQALGREQREGSYPLADGRVTIAYRSGDARASGDVSAATMSAAGDHGTEIGIGRDGCAITYYGGWLDIIADLETPQDVTVDGRGNLFADCRSEPGEGIEGIDYVFGDAPFGPPDGGAGSLRSC
jgi:hypothetical protein